MSSPDPNEHFSDLIDVVVQACQKNVPVLDESGRTVSNELQLDPKTLWYKTGSVNSNTFARFAWELEEFYRSILGAFSNMCGERATILSMEGREIVDSYMRSIDAKSSESQYNKDNKQSTLLDKINRKSQERIYTTNDKAKGKSMLDVFLGKDKEKDIDND